MSKMSNFYELFDVLPNASSKEIIMAYENKITKFNKLKALTSVQTHEIKMLKVALYVLITPELKNKYNKSFNKIKSKTEEPQAINSGEFNNLDSLFNVDNSWMKDINSDSSTSVKKNKLDLNIGDRVFSLCDLNKRPGFSSDFEAELRKPQQGREDKSNQLLNKNKT